MFVVYSKKNGAIKNIATGGNFRGLEDLFPEDYEDYNLIYNCGNFEDDQLVINSPDMFKVIDNRIALKEDRLNKYR